jgi:hypothetical protein
VKMMALRATYLLVLVLGLAAPALAQSPAACGCYCGIVISPPCSEQACKQACGWNSGDGGDNNGIESGPTQLWYCRAVAPDGAWGWAWSPDQSWARRSSLNECQRRASGCALDACRINDPSLSKAPTATQPPVAGQSHPTSQPEWCDLCTHKLRNDVNSGWASALIRSYVGQAIAGYENCKRMAEAGGICIAGDQLRDRLRSCEGSFFSAYRQCISNALGDAR